MDRDAIVAKLWRISNVYWEPEETISEVMGNYDTLTARLARAEAVVEAVREFASAEWITDTSIEALCDALAAYDHPEQAGGG